jgi:hypothetical protein
LDSIGDTRSVALSMATTWAASDGCYDAVRAAALSGVPRTTVYWWASHDVVVPSVSESKEKLWSYADLMALRIVSWLRHAKHGELPASPMRQVRTALALLAGRALELWSETSPPPVRSWLIGPAKSSSGLTTESSTCAGIPQYFQKKAWI